MGAATGGQEHIKMQPMTILSQRIGVIDIDVHCGISHKGIDTKQKITGLVLFVNNVSTRYY